MILKATTRARQLSSHLLTFHSNQTLHASPAMGVSSPSNVDCEETDKNVQSKDDRGILNFVDPKDKSGEFKRQTSAFRNWVSPKPDAEFPAERDRYHLCTKGWPYARRERVLTRST